MNHGILTARMGFSKSAARATRGLPRGAALAAAGACLPLVGNIETARAETQIYKYRTAGRASSRSARERMGGQATRPRCGRRDCGEGRSPRRDRVP